ncbi:hypothetical protein ACJX0J_020231, partial [Zea mays]
ASTMLLHIYLVRDVFHHMPCVYLFQENSDHQVGHDMNAMKECITRLKVSSSILRALYLTSMIFLSFSSGTECQGQRLFLLVGWHWQGIQPILAIKNWDEIQERMNRDETFLITKGINHGMINMSDLYSLSHLAHVFTTHLKATLIGIAPISYNNSNIQSECLVYLHHIKLEIEPRNTGVFITVEIEIPNNYPIIDLEFFPFCDMGHKLLRMIVQQLSSITCLPLTYLTIIESHLDTMNHRFMEATNESNPR